MMVIPPKHHQAESEISSKVSQSQFCKPVDKPATAQAWFSGQPQINIVARDRGGGYALAAATALPNAIQVADR
jgi:hypothetical protein